MSSPTLTMIPIQLVDIIGSALMIAFALLCIKKAWDLRADEPQNVIWTYLLWFSSGLLIFSMSRSVGHLVRHVLVAANQPAAWHLFRPVTGALNTLSFVIVGGITLFFHRIYKIYGQMREDKTALERAHKDIMLLNANLEEMVEARTKDLSISEEKYRVLFEGSKDMIFICNEFGDLLDINPAGVELLGLKDGPEAFGLNLYKDLMSGEDAKRVKTGLRNPGFLKDLDLRLRKVNGTSLDVLLSATARKIHQGQSWGFEGTVKDITMRKAMERQLLQADKLASLGQLSAGVAHEVNNPLGLILGYTELMLRETENGSQIHQDLEIVKKHAMNCKRIVEDLLKFSRSMDTQKTSEDLNDLISEVLHVVEANFELDKVQIVKRLASNLPPLDVDADKLRQVFMNLLMNARQAIEHSGTITVETSLSPDHHEICVSVTDTGSGIAPEIIDKIFDPFFTTKPTGMGTGLGLSVSYGIIKDHNGEIQVKTRPGEGATFTIRLPLDRDGTRRTAPISG